MLVWVLGGLVLSVVVAGMALQLAIMRNGPAVLSAVDRIAGGSGDAELLARIALGESDAQKAVIWGPADREAGDPALPVLLFAHGGSWRSGDPDDYGFIGRSFVPEGFITVLAGYRLHPDAVYPAMLEDTARAIAWTREEIAQYGGDPERIVLIGHSAGAYNVAMAALEEQWLGREGHSPRNLAGVVGLSGPYDFYPFDSQSTRNSFGHAIEPERTQPIAHVGPDAPPFMLVHGERDTLVKIRNSKVLNRRLSEAGASSRLLSFPEMTHNDPLISLAAPWRNSRDLHAEIVRFAQNPGGMPTTSVSVKRDLR